MSNVTSVSSNQSQVVNHYILSPLGNLKEHIVQKLQSDPNVAGSAFVLGNVLFFVTANKAASAFDAYLVQNYPEFSKNHETLKDRSIAILTGLSSLFFTLIVARLSGLQIRAIYLTFIAVSSAAKRLLTTKTDDQPKPPPTKIIPPKDEQPQQQPPVENPSTTVLPDTNGLSIHLQNHNSTSSTQTSSKNEPLIHQDQRFFEPPKTVRQSFEDDDYKNGVPPPNNENSNSINSSNQCALSPNEELLINLNQQLEQAEQENAIDYNYSKALLYAQIDQLLEDEDLLAQVRSDEPDQAPEPSPAFAARLAIERQKQANRKQKIKPPKPNTNTDSTQPENSPFSMMDNLLKQFEVNSINPSTSENNTVVPTLDEINRLAEEFLKEMNPDKKSEPPFTPLASLLRAAKVNPSITDAQIKEEFKKWKPIPLQRELEMLGYSNEAGFIKFLRDLSSEQLDEMELEFKKPQDENHVEEGMKQALDMLGSDPEMLKGMGMNDQEIQEAFKMMQDPKTRSMVQEMMSQTISNPNQLNQMMMTMMNPSQSSSNPAADLEAFQNKFPVIVNLDSELTNFIHKSGEQAKKSANLEILSDHLQKLIDGICTRVEKINEEAEKIKQKTEKSEGFFLNNLLLSCLRVLTCYKEMGNNPKLYAENLGILNIH